MSAYYTSRSQMKMSWVGSPPLSLQYAFVNSFDYDQGEFRPTRSLFSSNNEDLN